MKEKREKEMVRQCASLLQNGQGEDAVAILKKWRGVLPAELHKSQKRIDDLDYFYKALEKESCFLHEKSKIPCVKTPWASAPPRRLTIAANFLPCCPPPHGLEGISDTGVPNLP